MTIEYLIKILLNASTIKLAQYDYFAIIGIEQYIKKNNCITKKQSDLVVTILRKYKLKLESLINKNMDDILNNPIFETPFKVYSTSKTLHIESHPVFDKQLILTMSYDESFINEFKTIKYELDFASWDVIRKRYAMALTENNLIKIRPFIKNLNIQVDEEIQDYYNQISEIEENFINYLPYVKNTDKGYTINLFEHIISDNVIDIMFKARKLGITDINDLVKEEINSLEDKTLYKFLLSDPKEIFVIDNVSELSNIIPNLFPVLVVIPGGHELETIKILDKFLISMGVNNKEVSVLFRTDNKTNPDFNVFVKEKCFNNPIDDNTKVTMISRQIPKSLLKSNLHYNSIIDFGKAILHYRIKSYLRNHENVILVNDIKK
jgi:hypothetical protein